MFTYFFCAKNCNLGNGKKKMERLKMSFYIIILLIAVTASKAFGQTDLSSIIENVPRINLPYDEYGQEKRKTLNSADSLFLITRLSNKLPSTVNPYANSPFGQIDCEDMSDCLGVTDLKEIAILAYFMISEDNYLIHLEFTRIGPFGLSYGVLISMTKEGEIMDWIFSNGSVNGGNPNGNVSRDFSIQNDTTIVIDEGSWGKNNISYGLKVTYSVSQGLDEYDSESGVFDLKNFCINF